MDSNKMFSEFSKTSKKQWIERVVVDLKGADFDKKLKWKVYEDFDIQPFYTPEDTGNTKYLSDLYKIFSKEEGVDRARFWINYRKVLVKDEKKANREVMIALEGGADGIIFDLRYEDDIDLKQLLSGVGIENCAVSFVRAGDSLSFTKRYFEFLNSENVNLKKIRGFIRDDIISNYTTQGCKLDFEKLANTIRITNSAPNFYANVITTHHFVDGGSNYTQEIAFTVNKLVEYIDKLSKKTLTIQEILNNTMFDLAMGGDYFFDICKFRALRVLLLNVIEAYGENLNLDNLHIMGSSSLWTKSLYDPYVNMLRNTTETMSCVVGGANSISISAYDSSYEEPSDFSNRISLNISNLLKHEAYLDNVIDPSSGSYFLDNLTKKLIDYSLDLFKEIENRGGFLECVKNNFIQDLIEKVRDKKVKDISFRKNVFVGTNKYPNFGETLKEDLLNDNLSNKENCRCQKIEEKFKFLEPQRATQSFDKIRIKTEKKLINTGKRPLVYLALFGNLAMRKARSTFAADFFGIAGFEISENFFDSPKDAIKTSSESKADIVVICSSDEDYRAHAIEFAEEFKNKTDKILVLAGLPENIDELRSAGIDEFIHVKSNAVETLSKFQESLNIR